ncbi:hypothetical protein ABKN59_009687 [Abortiporus biennis]
MPSDELLEQPVYRTSLERMVTANIRKRMDDWDECDVDQDVYGESSCSSTMFLMKDRRRICLKETAEFTRQLPIVNFTLIYPPPLTYSSVLCNMDLNQKRFWKDGFIFDSSGKAAVFANLAEHLSKWNRNVLTAGIFYDVPPKWKDLGKQIQNIVIAVFEGWFHRNNWFQQSLSINNDAANVLNLNNTMWQELIEGLDAIIESFLHVESYGHTIIVDDIPNVLGVGWKMDEPLRTFLERNTSPPKSSISRNILYEVSTASFTCQQLIYNFFPNITYLKLEAIEINSSHILHPPSILKKKPLPLSKLRVHPIKAPAMFQWLSWSHTLTSLSIHATNLLDMLPSFGRNVQFLCVQWDMSRSQLDENLSFGADVLPALQTLLIYPYYHLNLVSVFCHILSRSSVSSSLSCIKIGDLPNLMNEQDFIVLDDTLAQLHDRVQISINKRYWNDLPKLQSKGVLMDI